MLTQYPDLRASVQNVNMFMGGGQRYTEIEFDLTGPSLEKLEAYSTQLMTGMRAIPGIVDVDTTLSVRQPELRVQINRQKASDFGIKVQDIAATLRTLVGGEPVTKFKEEQDQYDVWLRAQLPNRNDPHALSDLSIPSPPGELVKLANLATLSEERGPAQIDRYSRQRKVTIVANLDHLPLSVAIGKIRQLVADLDLPPTYHAEFSGRAKALGETGSNFVVAFLLSLLFMYMILAAQFESFLHPITILLALPLSLPFALLSLVVLGDTLNIYSVLGLFMLFGIVKKNGILQIDYTNTLRAAGHGARRGDPRGQPRAPAADSDDHGDARRRHDSDRARPRPRRGVARLDGQGDHRRPDVVPAAEPAADTGGVLAVRRPRPGSRVRAGCGVGTRVGWRGCRR